MSEQAPAPAAQLQARRECQKALADLDGVSDVQVVLNTKGNWQVTICGGDICKIARVIHQYKPHDIETTGDITVAWKDPSEHGLVSFSYRPRVHLHSLEECRQ